MKTSLGATFNQTTLTTAKTPFTPLDDVVRFDDESLDREESSHDEQTEEDKSLSLHGLFICLCVCRERNELNRRQ